MCSVDLQFVFVARIIALVSFFKYLLLPVINVFQSCFWKNGFCWYLQNLFIVSILRSNKMETCFYCIFLTFYNQFHHREVPRWEILMEQELRFGLDLGPHSCLPSFKIFWPMKPSYTSNEMIWFVAHFVSKIYEI